MTETEYIAYIADYLWRKDDNDLLQNLDELLDETNGMINTDLDIPTDNLSTVVDIDADGYGTLPNFRAIKAVDTGTGRRGMLSFVEPSTQLTEMMSVSGFTIINDKIYIGGPPFIYNNPDTVRVHYYPPLEPYFDLFVGDTSGFQRRHPHFYTAAACFIIAGFLRDEALESRSFIKYKDMLNSVRSYELNRFYGHATLEAPVPGIVA